MSLYLGPYVEAITSDVTVEAQRVSCPNEKCKSFTKETYDRDKKFCGQCGTAIGFVKFKTTKKKVDAFEHRDEIKEVLANICHDDYFSKRRNELNIETWIANTKFCERNCWIDVTAYSGSMEFNPEMIAAELTAFKKHFAKTLDLFTQRYSSVTIKWGMVCYWS
jgi:hypothetical protein